ncbi:hypothetical protein CBL_10993 [Carabus blaptoides fortunei]
MSHIKRGASRRGKHCNYSHEQQENVSHFIHRFPSQRCRVRSFCISTWETSTTAVASAGATVVQQNKEIVVGGARKRGCGTGGVIKNGSRVRETVTGGPGTAWGNGTKLYASE